MLVGGGDWKLESCVRHLIIFLVAGSDGRGERTLLNLTYVAREPGVDEWAVPGIMD
jgi:hypothetical protein